MGNTDDYYDYFGRYTGRKFVNYEDTNFTSFEPKTQDHEDKIIAEWANGKSVYDAKQNFMLHRKPWLNEFAINFEAWAANR